MAIIRIEDDSDRPASNSNSRTPKTTNPKRDHAFGVMSGERAILGLAVLALLVVLVLVFTMYNRVMIEPNRSYVRVEPSVTVTRDALTGKTDPVPDFFTVQDMARYELEGNGFAVNFRITNDPTYDYNTTSFTCGVPSWETYYATTGPQRRAFVEQKKLEFAGEKCMGRYTKPLSAVRTIEIGLDDTDGVNTELADFVRRNLTGQESQLVSAVHHTRLIFFKLSDADFLNRRTWEIPPGAATEAALRAWTEGLDWLLTARGPTRDSSIATGLFNMLNRNANVRLRQIIVFSDGMENDPRTTSFYRVMREPGFLDRPNWESLDERIAQVTPFSNLQFAKVSWFIPPVKGGHFQRVREYWAHVLADKCKSQTVDVVY